MATRAVQGLLLAMVAAGGPHAAPALGGQGRMVWLEADRFDDLGGWTRDAQFIDQMGSPYLLAVGLGTPVADAVTTLKVPQPGRYRLWARARDWAPEHSPGRFRIVLDGRPAEHVFGAAGKPGWRWEDGGVHELAGETELRLRDLTGFYARCDAILLTDDLGWTPPQDLQAIAELRRRLGGLSPTVEDAGPYDVVVVGGGLAGCMSAVSAARMGARTALIQNRPMLGGNASTEIVVPPVGVWPHGKHRPGPLDPRETGLIEEVRTAGDQRTREALHYPPRLLRLVQAEPGLDLYLNTHATGVEMTDEDTIGAVLALGVRDGQRRRFRSRLFVDCTGDGVIGVAAGADYRHGREPRSMYGEPHAPEVGDHKTMGNSIKYVSKPTAKPQPFEAPPWAMTFPHCSDFTPRRHPRLGGDIGWQWMLELGGNRDTYADAEAIRDDLLRLVFGIWDHVKNRCPKLKEKAADHQLVWVGHVAGKRESRRLLGDYVLTEHDIADQALQPDRVAYGGWSLDDHHPDGFFHRGRPVRIPGGGQYHGQTFSIPYRCLYSRNIENLLMAGRDISASHVALSDTRVMLTCAVMGQAAGTAAGLCVQRGTTPRGVYQRYLTDLQQQLLKDGAHIIGLPNRDPRDLARQAALSASSERLQEEGRLSAENVIDGYARAANGETHAWQPEEGDKTSWLQLAWAEPQAFNVVHVTFLTPRHLPDRFAVLVEQGGGWEAVAEVGSTDQRRHTLALERARASKLRVAFAGGGVAVNEVRVYDGPPRVVEVARRSERLKLAPDPAVMVPWSLGLDPRALPGIVVDGSQAAAEGRWSHSTWTRPYVGDGYLHDGNEAKAQKSLTFRPRISKAGRYEVRLAYTAYDNRATNTPVTIATADGSKTLRINQQEEPPIDRLWLSLGIFRLGPDPAIVVSNGGTDGYVVVDAVQLIPR